MEGDGLCEWEERGGFAQPLTYESGNCPTEEQTVTIFISF